jgi:hypothetical protein
VLVAAFLPETVLLVGLVLATLVGTMTVVASRDGEPAVSTDEWT